MSVAVLVPVKGFRQAKLRLRPVLDDPQRTHLARVMAERVVAAALDLPVAVVCDEAEVADWAEGLRVSVIWAPGRGLNGAVAHGVAELGAGGAERVVVSHADLPFASDLRPMGRFDGVTLVPDRRGDGTNVLCVPTDAGFEFSYGPRSFTRHRAEAMRLGLSTRVVDDARLAWDVDVAADLEFPRALLAEARDLLPVPCR
ncbi:MAG: 2-phospho-L-lactate guanylyltransferase [Acidimicrobiales bacterium]